MITRFYSALAVFAFVCMLVAGCSEQVHTPPPLDEPAAAPAPVVEDSVARQ